MSSQAVPIKTRKNSRSANTEDRIRSILSDLIPQVVQEAMQRVAQAQVQASNDLLQKVLQLQQQQTEQLKSLQELVQQHKNTLYGSGTVEDGGLVGEFRDLKKEQERTDSSRAWFWRSVVGAAIPIVVVFVIWLFANHYIEFIK